MQGFSGALVQGKRSRVCGVESGFFLLEQGVKVGSVNH
jgi:hypothetical protein